MLLSSLREEKNKIGLKNQKVSSNYFQRESPGGLPLTNEKAKSKQQQLREERKREYNELLNRKQVSGSVLTALLHHALNIFHHHLLKVLYHSK